MRALVQHDRRMRDRSGGRWRRAILLLALAVAGATATTGCPRGSERVNEHQRALEREKD